MENKIKIFESKQVRTLWDSDKEEWYFSVVDTVGVLTDKDYDSARKYWKVLKGRLKAEGSELVSFCYQLKMRAFDGKMRDTDCLDTKGVLRLVQSIPSSKAVPSKVTKKLSRMKKTDFMKIRLFYYIFTVYYDTFYNFYAFLHLDTMITFYSCFFKILYNVGLELTILIFLHLFTICFSQNNGGI